jgi:hypothetical protein
MSRTFQVTFDAHDPGRLAAFWAAALGYEVQPPPDGFATWREYADSISIPLEDQGKLSAAVDPEGTGPRLLFLWVPESKVAKNRMHLDLNVTDRESSLESRKTAIDKEVDRLVELGASKIAEHGGDDQNWTVMQDPEGNEFCVQ